MVCTIKYRRVTGLRQGERVPGQPDDRLLLMESTEEAAKAVRRIRVWLTIVILALLVSGVTAFPLETELRWIVGQTARMPLPEAVIAWLNRVHDGLAATNRAYPFLAYGTDWLAFAHIVLAALFIGPWRDPLRNKWVVEFGLIACVGVLFLALIAGPIRGIPFYWRLIDCSFGVFGALPLWMCLNDIRRLEER